MARIGEPMARVKAQEWPTPIPSQRLGIDPDGAGYLLEPLHDAEHAPIKERIERSGKRLEPAVQEYKNVDLATWYFWLKQAVETGLATVVKGKLPAKIDGTPRLDFIIGKPEPTATDKLTATLEKQAEAFNRLASAIEKLAAK